jgi:hypothetical protein
LPLNLHITYYILPLSYLIPSNLPPSRTGF